MRSSRSIKKSKFQVYYPVLLCLLSILTGLLPKAGIAQGDLLVTPKRVVFDGAKRSEEINLANIGKDTARYLISFVQVRMTQKGTFERINEPDSGQNFADKNLRFFPRSVVLPPNESQVIKIQVAKTSQLLPGEYRSHIYFRAIPNEKPLGEPEPVKDSSISIQLIPVFGISIPVIIRVGETTANVTLSDVSIETERDTLTSLKMLFRRTGNMSVYGDVLVDHISLDGKTTRVGMVNGVAVYTPLPDRQFRLALKKVNGINYHTGKLHVTYADRTGKKLSNLAEAEVMLR